FSGCCGYTVAHSPGNDIVVQNFSGIGLVIDDEYGYVLQLIADTKNGSIRSHLKRHSEPKRGAFTFLAFHTNSSIHQFYEPLGDTESQTCTAEFSSYRSIGLRKGLE